MPFLEDIVQTMDGAKYFFSLDAFKGYWNFPLHKDTQEILSFMTDRGVYTPTRALQGHLNTAVAQFQGQMFVMFEELLWKKLIIWIDDLFGFATSIEDWYNNLDRVLEIAEVFGLKFNIKKCDLFLKEA